MDFFSDTCTHQTNPLQTLGFRDDRELVQQFKGVLAACLCIAFDEQLSTEGKHLIAENEKDKESTAKKPAGTIMDEQGHKKPVATWDLEDCRSWLLEASCSIAQAWDAERQTNSGSTLAKKIPSVPLDDLEGHLVGQSFMLCEHLEAELQSLGGNNNTRGGCAVATPRVTHMSKLDMGSRSSAGDSGQTIGGSSRTAGQILLLMTVKKLGAVLQDPLAGEAFHRKLRAIIGWQEAMKQKTMGKEATQQRKPYLQARDE